jgi:hypothetical protein
MVGSLEICSNLQRMKSLLFWIAIAALASARSFAAPTVTSAELRAKSQAFLEQWVQARDHNDPGLWAQLYDADHFEGAEDKEYHWESLSTWKAARAEEVAHARAAGEQLQISVDHITIELWTDRNASLEKNRIRVSFIERWRARCCARHGPVILQLAWNPQGQGLRIVWEDRVAHMDGFDDPQVTLSRDASSLDLDKAWAAWNRLPILGENVDVVLQSLTAKTAATPQVGRSLARAALARVEWQCERVYRDENYDEVGEIPEPAAKARIDDPCVGRKVALWALGQAALGEADLPAIGAALEAMLAQGEHADDDMQVAAAQVAIRFSEAVRYRLMTKSKGSAYGILRDTLSLPFQTRAALELHDGAAALRLDPRSQREAILHALADSQLDEGARIGLLRHIRTFSGPDVDEALNEVTTDDSCQLVMLAADALAQRGDPSVLPVRSNDAALNRIDLCRLVFDPNRERRLATWRSFLPPRGAASIVHTWDGGCSEEPGEKVRRVTRKNASLADLERSLGGNACWVATDDPLLCFTDPNPPETSVSFELRAGQLYVSEIRYETHRGCD